MRKESDGATYCWIRLAGSREWDLGGEVWGNERLGRKQKRGLHLKIIGNLSLFRKYLVISVMNDLKSMKLT